MKRSPTTAAFSLTSVLTAALLLGLLAWYAWRGNLLFSPGALSAQTQTAITLQNFHSHADFETQCAQCHQPLTKPMPTLCLACHTEIQAQIETNQIHARFPQAQQCTTCHSEHRGRDFNPSAPARQNFDHSLTRFSLLHHAVDYTASPMPCQACHRGANFALEPAACAQCHADHNPNFIAQHRTDFGEDCLQCHDGLDRFSRFDHTQTIFPLTGKHAGAACANCHQNTRQPQDFSAAPSECAACHPEPAAHRDLFSTQCAECHTPNAWQPAKLNATAFNHTQTTGFSLQAHRQTTAGEPFRCIDCHINANAADFSQTLCAECHTQTAPDFMQQHQQQVGSDCLQCHDGADRMTGFDHAIFPLDGAHAAQTCLTCHRDYRFAGISSACVTCHAEPDLHKGSFGVQCQYCHQTNFWQPAQLKFHPFPLNHGKNDPANCAACHTRVYAEYTCYTCHEHQPDAIAQSHQAAGIAAEQLPNCATCHLNGEVKK
ncbi:MAG: hypothetical protein OHK0052_21250 [Anaerolineales bacterium]